MTSIVDVEPISTIVVSHHAAPESALMAAEWRLKWAKLDAEFWEKATNRVMARMQLVILEARRWKHRAKVAEQRVAELEAALALALDESQMMTAISESVINAEAQIIELFIEEIRGK